MVSKGWADGLVISKVDGVLWDLDRVLEGDCKVEFLKFDNEEGRSQILFAKNQILVLFRRMGLRRSTLEPNTLRPALQLSKYSGIQLPTY